MRRNRYLLGLLVLFVVFSLSWWLRPRRLTAPLPEAAPPPETQTSGHRATRPASESRQPVQRQSTAPKASSGNAGVPGDVQAYVQNKLADAEYDWKQPINFYGRVLDENGAPVPGAAVDFKWNDLSAEGSSTTQAASDTNGYFSLLNKTGKRLYVQVHKDGYYTSRQTALAFEYANPADGLFTPEPNKPVLFQLRRKGVGANLVTSQVGMRDHLGVTAPLDGSPVRVDLLQRSTGQAGQLVIAQTKPNYQVWKQATHWSFRMEIPDGGFVEQNDEFPFEAPQGPYQPLVQCDFQQGQTNWATRLSKDYYIQFGHPPRYGRLHLETSIMMNGARLTYVINPDGARDLEPR
jgi:hypothetical protein